MRKVLHIIVYPGQSLPAQIIRLQEEQSGAEIAVADLSQGHVDYDTLLDKIFAADSVAVW